ncbi:MAG: 1,4-dihydroxy-2-naphthoate octaprenyltransferase [Desulfovibrionaceae bacterium]|nr:1,4-dihydroxy-2-naphthoate octaprenyltransferase [Desulfovibrionaceae bacterium]
MHCRLSQAFAPRKANAPALTTKQKAKAWWLACRPPFFIVDLIPVGLAFVLAKEHLGFWPWLECLVVLLGCFCLHTIANIANDLFDYLEGVDTEDSIGGTHIIQNGWISPREISIAIALLLLGTVLSGAWLISHSGQTWLWAPVLFAILSAVFYVAPPIRYGCRGFGELSVCLNMGFIMLTGAYAVMAKDFDLHCLAFALPVGLMVAGILYYQSLPEIETDLQAGKHTLANILGKAKATLVFYLWWPAVWLLLLNLWWCGLVSWHIALCLLTLPLYIIPCRRIATATEWLELDQYGHWVRKLYLSNGALLIVALLLK